MTRRHTAWRGAVVAASMGAAFAASAADLAAPKVMPAEAQVPPSVIDLAFSTRYQSNYIFRGISQSNNASSFQTSTEAQFFDNIFYAGVATYQVDLPTRPQMEMDLTAGIRPKFGPFQFDIGFIFYNYPGERRLIDFTQAPPVVITPRNTDFIEFAGKVTYNPVEELTLGANVYHAGNWLGTHADATYASGTFKYALPEKFLGILPSGFALSGEIGHYWLGRTGPVLGNVQLIDYTYGNVGLSYTWKNLTLEVRYHNTTLNKNQCFTNTGDPRGVFTGTGRSNWCGEAIVGTVQWDTTTKEPGIFAEPGGLASLFR